MWRAMLGAMLTNRFLPVGGVWHNGNGFGVAGIPPIPVPGAPPGAELATNCCGAVIPWTNMPIFAVAPYCGYFEIPAYPGQ